MYAAGEISLSGIVGVFCSCCSSSWDYVRGASSLIVSDSSSESWDLLALADIYIIIFVGHVSSGSHLRSLVLAFT